MKQSGNGALFALAFVLPALASYLSGWLWLGTLAPGSDLSLDDTVTARTTLLWMCYIPMSVACFIRGRSIGRAWLVLFPVAAGFFDIFLPIPFVPTMANVVAIVFWWLGTGTGQFAENERT